MTVQLANRVLETSTTTGTGSLTLGGAVQGFQGFGEAFNDADGVYYTIQNITNGEWEIGIGTWNSAGDTLDRDTVLESSNADALVNLSAGTHQVFVDIPASKAIAVGGPNQLPVTEGGTGSTTASAARTALGAASSGDNDDITSLLPTVELDRVSYTSSAIDAHKLVPFFLDEPAHVSPSFNWRRAIRQTSWYAELGAPPVHGAFLIDEANDLVLWIDLDSATLAVYMSFTVGASTMIYKGGSTYYPVELAALDFKLCVAIGGSSGSGMLVIDFLADDAINYHTAGALRRDTDITGRNDAGTSAVYNSALAIVSNNVKSVAICRDPSGGTDYFGRPLHYWAAGTAGGASMYNPITGGIYDSTQTRVFDVIALSNSGYMWGYEQDAGGDFIGAWGPFEGITANSYAMQASLDAVTDLPVTTGITFGGFASLGIDGDYDVQLLGTDEGLTIFGWNWAIPTPETFWRIHLTSTYVTPLLMSPTTAAYPLDSVTDRSGNANDLTNNGTTAFTGTSPLGLSCAHFDGTDDYLSRTGDNDFNLTTTGELTVSCYFKSDSASNPAGVEILCRLRDGGGNDVIDLRLTTSGYVYVWGTDDASSTSDEIATSVDLYDANWHHLCVVCDFSGNMKLYADNVLLGTTTFSNINTNLDCSAIYVGGDSGNYFDGMIANLSVNKSAWTADEVRLEYQRMQAGLAGFTTLLTADDIDSVQVAPDGEYAIVTAGDVAHIMDPRTGIILSTDAVGAGTLNDAAIWQRAGADTPAYLLGASTTVEAVQPDERIGG